MAGTEIEDNRANGFEATTTALTIDGRLEGIVIIDARGGLVTINIPLVRGPIAGIRDFMASAVAIIDEEMIRVGRGG